LEVFGGFGGFGGFCDFEGFGDPWVSIGFVDPMGRCTRRFERETYRNLKIYKS
jgi:hypothetical protein